jgi:hypothetical protein
MEGSKTLHWLLEILQTEGSTTTADPCSGLRLLKVLGSVHCMQLMVETAGVTEGFVVGGSAPEWGNSDTTVHATDTQTGGGLDGGLGGLSSLGDLDRSEPDGLMDGTSLWGRADEVLVAQEHTIADPAQMQLLLVIGQLSG